MKSIQYTIRSIPPSVDRILRKRAAEKKISLNAILLKAIESEAGLGMEPKVYDDLDHLIGSWVDDPKVDAALKEQRRVDKRDWE